MGTRLFDQYSLLHTASGIISYFFGIPLWVWFVIHILFEWIENTQFGIKFINNYLTFWPGGKPKADTIINRFGDTLSAMFGWFLAYTLDKYGKKKEWYFKMN